MDGCLGHFPVVWIPAIRAGMTAPWDARLKPIGGETGIPPLGHDLCKEPILHGRDPTPLSVSVRDDRSEKL